MPRHDTINHLQQVMAEGGQNAFDVVPTILGKVIRNRLWAKRLDRHGEPFKSFEAFATAKIWEGLETSIDKLRVYCHDDKHKDVLALVNAEIDPAPIHGGDHTKQGDNVTLKRGNNSTYALKRLKRDRADLFARVVAGELSPNAAAIKAGFRVKTITVPLDVERAADTLARHFNDEDLSALARAIKRRLTDD